MRAVAWVLVAGALALTGCGSGDAASTKIAADVAAEVAGDVVDETASDIGDEVAREVSEPPGRLRFVHVSDLHYAGTLEEPRPEYLATRIARVNAVPDVDLVVSTGDHVDYLEARYDEAGAHGPLQVVATAFDSLVAPWIAAIGNHEFYLSFEPVLEMCHEPAVREASFGEAFGFEPFSVHVVNGIRLILLDTMDGPTWDQNAGVLGSLTPERIAWLEQALAADDRPTVVFAHHPLSTLQDPEQGLTLCQVLQAHADHILGYFAGHLHSFLEGEACGIPYFLVGNWRDADDAFFVVDVDGQAGTLTVANEADLPFATPPEFTCEAGQAPLLGDGSAAVGTVQRLVVTNTSTDAVGLGQYVGDALQSIPFLLSIDRATAAGFEGRVTVASRWGDPEGFYSHVEGSPCQTFDWRLDDPCVAVGPATLAVNALLFLEALTDATPDPSWLLRIKVEDLRIEGRAALVEGVPTLAEGVLYARMETAPALADLKQIVVSEYCADRLEGCTPGASDAMPACPAQLGPDFFDAIPKACDLAIEGFSVRSILGMLKTLPETIHATGAVTTEVVPLSTVPTAGMADPALFSTEPGQNCAP